MNSSIVVETDHSLLVVGKVIQVGHILGATFLRIRLRQPCDN